MFLASDLRRLAGTYLDPAEVETIRRALRFGAHAHEGQHRASGEPYIHHPVQVAKILAEMRLDRGTIVAALLHDVIEDTPTAKPQIAVEFGDEVAELVDGVSKLTHLTFESRAEAQAENFRKMLMAMARDIRVMLIKLADRLHNMRTIDALALDKRRRIARETLDIYAPIANRLGLRNIRIELEDLGFRALYPRRYRVLGARVREARGHRKRVVRRIETAMKRRLRQEGIEGRVEGPGEVSLQPVPEDERQEAAVQGRVRRLRIPDHRGAARRLLPHPGHGARPVQAGTGAVQGLCRAPEGERLPVPAHDAVRPFRGSHRGCRSAPRKCTGSQSPASRRTGCTRPARPGTNTAQLRAREWVRDLLEMQTHAGDPLEFLESVKVDLFPKEIYVFTPAGDIMELPRGATPVDLAYAVHTDVGNQCVAVKVDGRFAPLRAPLSTGQTVEIVTAQWGRPNATWLDFVTTGKARTAIRNHLKHLRAEEAAELGERLLVQALAVESLGLDDVPARSWRRCSRS